MLRELLARTQRSRGEILEEALEAYRRKRLLDEANAAYDAQGCRSGRRIGQVRTEAKNFVSSRR
ncbi:MAG: hypothetical protein HY716_09800 [Planctomycetes bacterium]|nr:hypothetical protein [Planctomycetota bacterium]